MKNQEEAVAGKNVNLRVPDYLKNSITQLPVFISSVLKGSSRSPLHSLVDDSIDLNGIKNVVLFLVDGFGCTQWKKYSSQLEVLKMFENIGSFSSLDTVFPSSTPVALTTLQSGGLLPA